jgi:hypothetical protein
MADDIRPRCLIWMKNLYYVRNFFDTYIKSKKGSGNFPPLQNIINDKNLEEFAYDDEEKCDLLNKYFSFISKLDEANAPLPDIELKTNNNITDINVSIEEISDIIQVLHPNKTAFQFT